MRKILSIYILSLIVVSSVMAADEVKYTTVSKSKIYEIRKYPDRLVIETETSDQNSGFKRLFKYISGNNKGNRKIKMTTPVTQVEKNGSMTMQFYLPSKFKKYNTPSPSNSDVKIINIKGGYYAVIKYSGSDNTASFQRHKILLKSYLRADKILIISSPIRASYNRPFTLPKLRRNEVMFKIDINL
ncbi:heme-binding protein [Candidatus Pelagibacter sp. Uisw_092]|uniref:SOUL family heme-binding protein n=1 Tax=Candidatus Pelagibacter sp. Uisw_092 TaxID=3230979 RepID=UPI0039EC8728